MVTGSSGFIGQPLVRALAETKKTVVSVYHHRVPDALEGVYPVCSDLSSPELMAAPLRGVQCVVHLAWEDGLAGPTEPLPEDPLRAHNLTRNLRCLKNLLVAMERAGTRRIVFISALGASRNALSPFLREKYQAELLILNARIPEKIILRSSVVWGGEGQTDRFLASILRVMRYVVYPVPRKEGQIAPLHVKDLTSLLVAATDFGMTDEASLLELTGGESYVVDELFKLVSDSLLKKTQFPLRGFLGESLLPLLERERETAKGMPKVSQFLAIGASRGDEPQATAVDNPLASILPEKIPAFRERLNH